MLPYIELAGALRRPVGIAQAQVLQFSQRLSQLVEVLRTCATLIGDRFGRGRRPLSRPREMPDHFPVVVPVPRALPFTAVNEQPRLNSFLSLGPHGFHRLAYTEWGDPTNPNVVMCVHGFTRNSRDFDTLAAKLADKYRVVCMDVVGRGASDWLTHKDDYDFSLYLSDAAALLARVLVPSAAPGQEDEMRNGTPQVDWVGTSMGGLIGMMLAAKSNTLIRRLVLNDVGPLVPWLGLARLRHLHRRHAPFRNLTQVAEHLRDVCDSFGPLHDEQWEHVVRHGAHELDDGTYVLAYDPDIMGTMRHARRGIDFGSDFLAGVDLWPTWDRVRCPTLTLRGTESDLLLRSTSERMQRRGPKTQVVELAGIGHAPWLMTDDQIGIVRDFLLEPLR